MLDGIISRLSVKVNQLDGKDVFLEEGAGNREKASVIRVSVQKLQI